MKLETVTEVSVPIVTGNSFDYFWNSDEDDLDNETLHEQAGRQIEMTLDNSNSKTELSDGNHLTLITNLPILELLERINIYWVTVKVNLTSSSPESKYVSPILWKSSSEVMSTYLERRKIHSQAPYFYAELAMQTFDSKFHELGIQMLSNIAELELENIENYRFIFKLLHKLILVDFFHSN